ncbi:hypothetical protein V6D40_07155 [Corynebacterium sp. Q4381]|uniref:hypothetical protein n=1 Tax=Corynebacterium sp. Marseille-Q4381 TaxID=3121597 RepID=UPI002FE52B1D
MAWIRTAGSDGYLFYRSRRFFGAGVELFVAGLGVEGLGTATLQVQDPITVPTTTRKDIHKAVVLILREGLQTLGFSGIRDIEIDVIGWLKPEHRIARGVKLHRHTVLLRVHLGSANIREIPQGDWVFTVIFEAKRENVVRHVVKRIRKARVMRRTNRSFPLGDAARRREVKK